MTPFFLCIWIIIILLLSQKANIYSYWVQAKPWSPEPKRHCLKNFPLFVAKVIIIISQTKQGSFIFSIVILTHVNLKKHEFLSIKRIIFKKRAFYLMMTMMIVVIIIIILGTWELAKMALFIWLQIIFKWINIYYYIINLLLLAF